MSGDRETLRIGPPPHRRRSVIIVAVCIVVVFGGLGWWRFGRPSDTSSSAPLSPSPAQPTLVVATIAVTPPPSPYRPHGTPPHVSSADLSWLHDSSGWELFVRTAVPGGMLTGSGAVVRVQPRQGRVTRTAVPSLGSGGPVAFVVGSHAAYVHPLDSVPAFVVPDGMPAGRSEGLVPDGGILVPGPTLDQVWTSVESRDDTTLVLLRLPADPYGRPVPLPHSALSLPGSAAGFPFSDGAGAIMVARGGGTDDLRPGRAATALTGSVVATGPRAWVTTDCNGRPPCRLTVIDPSSGARHTLASGLSTAVTDGGRTASDGETAALLVGGNDPRLALVDLTDGTRRTTKIRVGSHRPVAIRAQGLMAWSPDGRWLFVVDAHHHVLAIDPQTGSARRLRLPLSAQDGTAQQIVIRP